VGVEKKNIKNLGVDAGEYAEFNGVIRFILALQTKNP
jgi:hypothetical protein